ncbi:MAG: response regulator [Myxococcota bacterium]
MPAPTLESRSSAVQPNLAPRRPLVLVIDPDLTARSVLEVALTRDGFDVWSADNSEQGLELMAVERVPDVVVLESDLGTEDGFSLVSQLRGASRTANVKVLLLARASEQNAAAVAEVVGVDDVIHKPAFARDISALVRLELARRDGAPMTFQAATLPPAQLLRALLTTPRSGQLILADGRGQVLFRGGRVTDVRFEGKGDLEALTRALAFTRGTYSVRLRDVPNTDDVVCGLRDLVQRVMPRLGRWSKVLERSLPLDARLAVDFGRLSNWIESMPDEVNRIVRLFDGHRSVEDVVADSPFDETLTLEVSTRLYLMGVIGPTEKSKPEILVLRQAPKLFEPRPNEVEELMHQLFEGKVEIRGEDPGVGLSADDWFSAPQGTGLEVADPAGGWQATPPAALTQGLAPELKAQLNAFEIPVHVEAPETPPAERAMQDFVRESAATQTVSMEQVLRSATGDAQAQAERPAKSAREPMPELASAPHGQGTEPRATLEDPQERIITPILTPAVAAAGTDAQERIITPILMKAVAEPQQPAAQAAHQAFFNEDAFVEEGEALEAELPRSTRRPVWPFLALALGVLGIAVLFDALRAGPPPVEAPQVSFRGLLPPPLPVVLPDIDEPVFFDDAPAPEAEVVDVSENLAEAQRLYDSGRYSAAKSLLEQVLTDDPKSVTAWTLLGLVKYDSNDVPGAREAADKVLALDPTNARVQVLLATLFFEEGKKAEGRAALNKYLELEPDGPFAEEARALLTR